jgi:hypothetical protein
MSNAKRRHRGRRRRQIRWGLIARIEADLAARGYKLTNKSGWLRCWSKSAPAPAYLGLEIDVLYVEMVETP